MNNNIVGSMANAHVIKEVVMTHDTSEATIRFIIKMTEFDDVPMPITRIPLSKVALAALHMLGIQEHVDNDEGVQFYIHNFQYLKEIDTGDNI